MESFYRTFHSKTQHVRAVVVGYKHDAGGRVCRATVHSKLAPWWLCGGCLQQQSKAVGCGPLARHSASSLQQPGHQPPVRRQRCSCRPRRAAVYETLLKDYCDFSKERACLSDSMIGGLPPPPLLSP